MTPEQRQLARELFEMAVDREEHDRARLLDAPGLDETVRREVRSLLEHHTRAGNFLTHPVAEVAPHLLDESGPILPPGAVLGPYTVACEVGRGGMGRVYRASDERLGRTVALKMLAPELTRQAEHRDRLRREARAAARLTHPGICTVFALEELDGELYIVSEFVDGRTLRREIAEGPRPSLASIVATMRELADAVASAHEKGVTHRDLKPENVMRTAEGHLKVLDFGLARIAAGDAPAAVTAVMPGGIAGTPAYMAPEQIEGRQAGPAADVFAFGVLMYEWISGQHPFQAASPLATLARVLDSQPDALSSRTTVPVWVSDVIARCLRKRPEERYATATELLAAIDAASGAGIDRLRDSTWWRTHQAVAILLYILAAAHAWQIKEWIREPIPLWTFVAMGIVASVAGIIRGHLVFTDVMNPGHLPSELGRTRTARLSCDLLLAGLLAGDALLLAAAWPLTAVLTLSLSTGIALASLLMEPATTSALLGRRAS